MFLVLIAGLVVGLVVLKRSQDTRRKAAGEPIIVNLSPPDGTAFAGASVGMTIPVAVKVTTTGTQTVGMISMRVRYSPDVFEIASDANIRKSSLLNGLIGGATIDNVGGYVDVIYTAGGAEITGTLVDLFVIDFSVKATGASATVEVDKDFDQFLVGGASGEEYSLTSDVIATYSIGNPATITVNPCTGAVDGTSCGRNRKCINNTCVLCAENITCAVGFHGCSSDEYNCRLSCCPDATGTVSPTPTLEELCVVQGGTWRMFSDGCKDSCAKAADPTINCTQAMTWGCDCGVDKCWAPTLEQCMDNPVVTAPPTVPPTVPPTAPPTIPPTVPPTQQPTMVPTNPPGADTVSFEVAMAGVRGYSKCLGDNTVDVVMLKENNRKEYKNVPLTSTSKTTSKGELVFRVNQLNVTDFGEDSGVAIFVKGMRHLQMKYGENNQTGVYNESGGQLSFDNNTTLNFAGYVMLAGDVNRDGTVDGVDFVGVKARASTFEAISEGSYSQYDLDGSCQVNNSDIILLIQALNEKYDQMY